MNLWMVATSQGSNAPSVVFYDPNKLSENVKLELWKTIYGEDSLSVNERMGYIIDEKWDKKYESWEEEFQCAEVEVERKIIIITKMIFLTCD